MSFDPFTMAVMAAATAAVGNIYQGNSQAAAYETQAKRADQNAELVRLQTNAAEDTQRRSDAMQMGRIRASAVQSGFDPNSGSLADLQTRSAGELELDTLTQRYRGQLEAIGLEQDAASYRANASSARKTGYLNAFGSIMSATSNYVGGSRIGPPAPVETRVPTPNPYYKGS